MTVDPDKERLRWAETQAGVYDNDDDAPGLTQEQWNIATAALHGALTRWAGAWNEHETELEQFFDQVYETLRSIENDWREDDYAFRSRHQDNWEEMEQFGSA